MTRTRAALLAVASLSGAILAASCSALTRPLVVENTAQGAAPSPCVSIEGKADRRCTPGTVNPDVTQTTITTTICTPGWTARVRPPSDYTTPLKAYQMRLYGAVSAPPTQAQLGAYREDHLIALELGGATRDPLNLWPQPIMPAVLKNNDAARLKIEVCAGRMTLIDAQTELVARWTQNPI